MNLTTPRGSGTNRRWTPTSPFMPEPRGVESTNQRYGACAACSGYKLRTIALHFAQHFAYDSRNGFGVDLGDISVLSFAITADVFDKQTAEPS